MRWLNHFLKSNLNLTTDCHLVYVFCVSNCHRNNLTGQNPFKLNDNQLSHLGLIENNNVSFSLKTTCKVWWWWFQITNHDLFKYLFPIPILTYLNGEKKDSSKIYLICNQDFITPLLCKNKYLCFIDIVIDI